MSGEWAAELGRALLVPADSENTAVVLFPAGAAAALRTPAPLTLLATSGDTTTATVASVLADSLECGDAATLRFTGTAQPTWTVGLLSPSAAPLHLDSIASLSAADSGRLVAELARLASALPMPATARFGGLPFVVLSAYHFNVETTQIVVAQLVRRIGQESAPLEERTFLIAERRAAGGQPFTATYHQRSEGSEDTAEHFEVLGAIQGRESVLLLIGRDQLSRTTYEVLERKNGWRVRWSRLLSC